MHNEGIIISRMLGGPTAPLWLGLVGLAYCHLPSGSSQRSLDSLFQPSPHLLTPTVLCYGVGMCVVVLQLHLQMIFPLHCILLTLSFKRRNSLPLIRSLSPTVLIQPFLFSQSGLPGWLVVNSPTAKAGDMSSIPGSERPHGGGNGNSLQYSCLGNLVNRGAWRAPVHGVSNSWTQLSD